MKVRRTIRRIRISSERHVPCTLMGKRAALTFVGIAPWSLALLVSVQYVIPLHADRFSLQDSEQSVAHQTRQPQHRKSNMCVNPSRAHWRRSFLQVDTSPLQQATIDTTYSSQAPSDLNLPIENTSVRWQHHSVQAGDRSSPKLEHAPQLNPPLMQRPLRKNKIEARVSQIPNHSVVMPSRNTTPLDVPQVAETLLPKSAAQNKTGSVVAAISLTVESFRVSLQRRSADPMILLIICATIFFLFVWVLAKYSEEVEFSQQSSLSTRDFFRPTGPVHTQSPGTKFANPLAASRRPPVQPQGKQTASSAASVGSPAANVSSPSPSFTAESLPKRMPAEIVERAAPSTLPMTQPSTVQSAMTLPSPLQSAMVPASAVKSTMPSSSAAPSAQILPDSPQWGARQPETRTLAVPMTNPDSSGTVSERFLCPGLVVPKGSECVVAIPTRNSSASVSFNVRELTGPPVIFAEINPPTWGPTVSNLQSQKSMVMLRTSGTKMLIASCKAGPEASGRRNAYIHDKGGDLFGHLTKVMAPELPNDGGSPCYVLTSGRIGLQWLIEGNFREYAVNVIGDQQRILADSEPSVMTFDPKGSYYKLRVREGVDVGLVLCALLSVDLMEMP